MTSSSRHIAKANASEALGRLNSKINAMSFVLASNPINHDALLQLPRSFLQFKTWTANRGAFGKDDNGNAVPDQDLLSCAGRTVDRNDKRDIVDKLLDETREYLAGVAPTRRQQEVTNLQNRLAFSERLRGIAEQTIRQLLARCNAAEEESRSANARALSVETKCAEILRATELEFAEERKRSAALTEQMRKVTRLERTA